MQDPQADKAIRQHFNSRARKIAKVGSKYLVPLKYDKKGEILTEETIDIRQHLKSLTLNDWKFLECWRRHEWNVAKAAEELSLPEDHVKRLVKRMSVFQQEEARDKALATIPTATYIQARHVENVIDGGKLDDSQRDSLKELAKINGAYKNNAAQINIQQNFLQMPALTPDQEKEVRQMFDTIATQQESAA